MDTDMIKGKAMEIGIQAIGATRCQGLSFVREPPERLSGWRPKSAIVAIQSYRAERIETGDPLLGIVAPFARCNYYRELRKKLEKLAKFLKSELGASCYVASNGPVMEKPLARMAGIGSYGLNRIIQNPVHGSRIVIGEILTDLDLTPDDPSPELSEECRGCGKCLRACPTGALAGSGEFKRERCLQWLKQNAGKPAWAIPIFGKTFYGCSRCQDACPANERAAEREDYPADPLTTVFLPEILRLDDEGIRERFRGLQMSASWIPPEALVENALIILSKSPEGRDFVKDFSRNGRPSLRETALRLLETGPMGGTGRT